MLATHKNFTWLTDGLLLSLILMCFYFLWLGSYPLFTPDEGRYSEVAREMIVRNDYITPHLNNVVFLDKPILYYWLQVLAIKLFGLKEWALRFSPALLGILGILQVYYAGRILFNRQTGLHSSLILASSPLYFSAAHYANLDLEVAVWISSTLLFFIMGVKAPTSKKASLFFLISYVFASFALLTKGLIGLIFPILIGGTWICSLRAWHYFRKMHLLLGILIILLIACPWYTLVQIKNPQFFHYFFITQQFSRFLTQGDFNNQTYVWFYLPIIAMGFIPWSLFIVQAFYHFGQLIWQQRETYQTEFFLIIWALIIFIFFSIPHSKTLGYILPIFPALSLLVGKYLCAFEDHPRLGMIMGGICFNILTLGISVYCLWVTHSTYIATPPDLARYILLTGIILIIAWVCTYLFLRTSQLKLVIYSMYLTTFLFLIIFIASAHSINHKSIKPLALLLKPKLKATDEIVTYQKYFQDLPLYTERQITIVANWHSKAIPYHDNWQRELWFGMPYKDTSPWLIEESTFWKKWRGNKQLYAFMYSDYFPHFKKKARHKAYVLGIANGMILVSNQILS